MLSLERCRNGRTGEWRVEFDHAAHRFSLVPRWPILRFLADKTRNSAPTPADAQYAGIDNRQPLVLAVEASGGARIAALNAAAENAGLSVGEQVADARAKVDLLQVHARRSCSGRCRVCASLRCGRRATRRLYRCGGEQNGADGFFLDVTGAAHLFGGEEKLLADLSQRLTHFGLPARLRHC